MSAYKPIVDIIGKIVSNMADDKPCVYLHGHPLEIINILAQQSTNGFANQKFPLVALFQDFKESVNNAVREVSLNIVIITDSMPLWNASERYDKTFNPTLYPLWDLLIKYLKRSDYIENKMDFTYEKTDRLFWGKQGLYGTAANIFNDYIDAIEIENLRLLIKEKC